MFIFYVNTAQASQPHEAGETMAFHNWKFCEEGSKQDEKEEDLEVSGHQIWLEPFGDRISNTSRRMEEFLLGRYLEYLPVKNNVCM